MKRKLVWRPGTHSSLNHLYDIATGKAICGSKAAAKHGMEGWGLNFWQEKDCQRCKSVANELEETEIMP